MQLSSISSMVRPAQQSLLPSLARTPEELIGSNGATSTIESLGTLVGPLLAGVLVATLDAGVVFAAGAGALLVSAFFFARVAVEGGVVRYRRNGALLYTSAAAPSYPLLVDAALYTQGATLNNAVLGGTW